MLSWMRTLVCGPAGRRPVYDALEKPGVSRQELTKLFADELDRPRLRKRSPKSRNKQRMLIAGTAFPTIKLGQVRF